VLAPNEHAIISGIPVESGDIIKASATDATTVDYDVTGTGISYPTNLPPEPITVAAFDANGALKQVNTGVSGNQTISGNLTVNGVVDLGGVVSPAAFAASADDLAIGAVSIVRVTTGGGGPQNFTGMVPTVNGQLVLICNIGTVDTITIKHSATSSAANQFIGPNSADVALRKNGSVYAWYDGTSSKWRVMGA
jgi:hypothetical protein